jgi:D-glycero-beta-D-manno-heptose-7-phosphate kinase
MKIPDTSKARILIVGDVMLDRYWFGDVSRISPEAPVPVAKVERTEDRPGGAANVARNCVALGAPTTLLSVVGTDEPGKTLTRLLRDAGVDASLHADANLNTTVKLRVVARQQQLIRIDFENAPDHEVLRDKLADFEQRLTNCDAVILSDYGKGGLTHITDMIRLSRAAGKPVLVDPKGDDYARYAGATIITPNKAELREVVGQWKNEADLAARAQKLRVELELEAILLTRSEEGMTLFTAQGETHETAKTREVFDVSGAGDTVIGVLAVMMACGSTLSQAMKLANQAAGIVVAKLGAAVATLEELKSLN